MLVIGRSSVDFSLHPSDETLRITNFQNTTPTNATDQGAWRSEIGQASITTDATGAGSIAITLETAFRTSRIALVSAGSNHDFRVSAHTLSTTGFTINVYGGPALTAVTINWEAIGQV